MTRVEAYLWDRLVRATERPTTPLQRHDLAYFIRTQTSDHFLLDAADKLVRGELSIQEAKEGLAKWDRAVEPESLRPTLPSQAKAFQEVRSQARGIVERSKSVWQKLQEFLLIR